MKGSYLSQEGTRVALSYGQLKILYDIKGASGGCWLE